VKKMDEWKVKNLGEEKTIKLDMPTMKTIKFKKKLDGVKDF